jgi:hypothetical protein
LLPHQARKDIIVVMQTHAWQLMNQQLLMFIHQSSWDPVGRRMATDELATARIHSLE